MRMGGSRLLGRVGGMGKGLLGIGGLIGGGVAGMLIKNAAESHEAADTASSAAEKAAGVTERAEAAAADSAKATKAGTKAAEAATTTAAKTGKLAKLMSMGGKGGLDLAKMGGKSLLKKLPFISVGAGALFAGQRMMQGDGVGAGMEMMSGVASMLPGIGTAASLALDASLMARDAVGPDAVDKSVKTSLMNVLPFGKDDKAAPATPVDDQALKLARSAQAQAESRLKEAEKTAMTNPVEAEMKKIQEDMKAIQEAQLAILREQSELLKRGNAMQSTIVSSLT